MKNKLYKLFIKVIPTPICGIFFKCTKPFFFRAKRTRSFVNRAWWYGYLFYYAHHYDIEKLKNNNKGYRIVKQIMHNFNWFNSYNTVFQLDCISHILYEMSQGYIPIIDDKYGVWNQFFEQPILPIENMEEINNYPFSDVNFTMFTPSNIEEYTPIRKLWAKLLNDFCRLKPNENEYIQNEINEVLGNGNNVLGVVCRGTDYIGTGMPKQPSIKQLSDDIDLWMKNYNYDKIYLATEDSRIYDSLYNIYKDKILINKRQYYDKKLQDSGQKWIGFVAFERENDEYLKGLEYYSSISILSKCNALLAGKCGATGVALLLNDDKYERFKVYKLGISVSDDTV